MLKQKIIDCICELLLVAIFVESVTVMIFIVIPELLKAGLK